MDFDQLVWVQPPIGEGWEDVTPDPVIWTAVDLLEQAWRSAGDYVGPGGEGSNQPGKYQTVGKFLRRYAGQIQLFIPCVSIAYGEVEFTDGRHRFAWLRDRGLKALPVEVDASCETAYRARFETDLRVGRLDGAEA
ncbi:hypothetical protein [Ralstonia pseudosolanacearum]|uniref:hypothetical protein n=1 Tax=Ralstonia pseudosolanacearum TaxID=1310165 RepID=UPI001FF7915A|nr:hypothetical protein [Ralstonia pseudosolanacearum]